MDNIGELKKAIATLPDDMPVGGSGHYGEFLEVHFAMVETVCASAFGAGATKEFKAFVLGIEDAGPEPD